MKRLFVWLTCMLGMLFQSLLVRLFVDSSRGRNCTPRDLLTLQKVNAPLVAMATLMYCCSTLSLGQVGVKKTARMIYRLSRLCWQLIQYILYLCLVPQGSVSGIYYCIFSGASHSVDLKQPRTKLSLSDPLCASRLYSYIQRLNKQAQQPLFEF